MADAPVVLITGSGRGIGAAIATGLAARGYDIVINDLPDLEPQAASVAQEIGALGRRHHTVFADVSDERSVQQMADNVLREFGRLDGLVNNAGILWFDDIEALSEARWDETMAINAKGPFLVTRAFLGAMKEQKFGRVVNISSIGGKQGSMRQAHYAASKAAVLAFTRVLAQEVAPFGITANSVCPGIISTELAGPVLNLPSNRDFWIPRTAMGRFGTPADVVGPVAFFLSEDAGFVTGQSLNVDGGILFS